MAASHTLENPQRRQPERDGQRSDARGRRDHVRSTFHALPSRALGVMLEKPLYSTQSITTLQRLGFTSNRLLQRLTTPESSDNPVTRETRACVERSENPVPCIEISLDAATSTVTEPQALTQASAHDRQAKERLARKTEGERTGINTVRREIITGADLPEFGTEEQTRFMRKVYELQRQRAAKTKEFVGEVPASELDIIEGDAKGLKIMAAACRSLLAAARRDLADEKRRRVQLARNCRWLGVASGYRSAEKEKDLWRQYFERYHRETTEQRAKMKGGEHGAQAASWLSFYIAGRKATAGYSWHNNGAAVDFMTRQGAYTLATTKTESMVKLWHGSWFFKWLSENAPGFGFRPRPDLGEPWHWELRSVVEQQEEPTPAVQEQSLPSLGEVRSGTRSVAPM